MAPRCTSAGTPADDGKRWSRGPFQLKSFFILEGVQGERARGCSLRGTLADDGKRWSRWAFQLKWVFIYLL